ncbi:MAG: permease-like cell division protein FtsX [Candidatus Magasanikbacteria bacterium]|nr:permease-like cell division protein FtsX [Candidatus Magasanikbacteria bacterium]
MFIRFFRVVKFAFQDILRNFSLSFMTVLILVLMLLSINTLIIIRVLTFEATNTIKNQIDVSVYFDYTSTEEDVSEVLSYLESFPEVVEITLMTRDEVLVDFKEQHKDSPDILASLEELSENPLGPTLVVKARETSDYDKIITALSVPEYEDIIEAKTFADTEQAIERIDTVTSNLEKFIFAFSGLFAVIAFVIIFNTIRVSVYTQRMEITIKKLVGATNWFVRGPYLVEAVLFSFLSTIFALAFVFMTIDVIDPYIKSVFQRSDILTNYFNSNIIMLFVLQFVGVLLLTAFSSFLAMRRSLKS